MNTTPVQEVEHDLEVRSEQSVLLKWENRIIEIEKEKKETERRFDFAGDYIEEL